MNQRCHGGDTKNKGENKHLPSGKVMRESFRLDILSNFQDVVDLQWSSLL